MEQSVSIKWTDTQNLLPPPSVDGFRLTRRVPSRALAADVIDMTGYEESLRGHFRQVETASLVVALVISFGDPFAIGLGSAPDRNARHGTFGAGLFAGPVIIDSFGRSSCVQVNFSPQGGRRFFGVPMRELAERMVPLDALVGAQGMRLRERLGEEHDWERRLDIVEAFVAARLDRARAPCPAIGHAYGRLAQSRGNARIGRVAAELGWSRKHLAEKFRDEIGLSPKAIGRIMRFDAALHLARGRTGCWAEIAAAAGYADQAHMVREFRELAGSTPAQWRSRLA